MLGKGSPLAEEKATGHPQVSLSCFTGTGRVKEKNTPRKAKVNTGLRPGTTKIWGFMTKWLGLGRLRWEV